MHKRKWSSRATGSQIAWPRQERHGLRGGSRKEGQRGKCVGRKASQRNFKARGWGRLSQAGDRWAGNGNALRHVVTWAHLGKQELKHRGLSQHHTLTVLSERCPLGQRLIVESSTEDKSTLYADLLFLRTMFPPSLFSQRTRRRIGGFWILL